MAASFFFFFTSVPTPPRLSSYSPPTMAFSKTLNPRLTTLNPLLKPSTSTLHHLSKPYLRSSPPRNTIRSLFTGLVEEMGHVIHLGPSPSSAFDLRIAASTVLPGVQLGDSIAVNGTCLIVLQFHAGGLYSINSSN